MDVHQIRVDVRSYTEFNSLLDQYVTQGAVPISYNVSDEVDSDSYTQILNDLIDSILKKGRRDKIEIPRFDHRPPPVVRCHTAEEMQNVYNAINICWRVIMCERIDDPGAKKRKLMAEMREFQSKYGIRDDLGF